MRRNQLSLRHVVGHYAFVPKKAYLMRKFIVSLAMLGAAYAMPASAAPALQPATAAIASSQAAVQTVQYGYDRREYRRRQEFRRREAIRRERHRRRAVRHGYVRGY